MQPWRPPENPSRPARPWPSKGLWYVCSPPPPPRSPLWGHWFPASCSNRSHRLRYFYPPGFSAIPRAKATRRRVCQRNAGVQPALPLLFSLTLWPFLLTGNHISTSFLSTCPWIPRSSLLFRPGRTSCVSSDPKRYSSPPSFRLNAISIGNRESESGTGSWEEDVGRGWHRKPKHRICSDIR